MRIMTDDIELGLNLLIKEINGPITTTEYADYDYQIALAITIDLLYAFKKFLGKDNYDVLVLVMKRTFALIDAALEKKGKENGSI